MRNVIARKEGTPMLAFRGNLEVRTCEAPDIF